MIFGTIHTRRIFNNGDYPFQIWILKKQWIFKIARRGFRSYFKSIFWFRPSFTFIESGQLQSVSFFAEFIYKKSVHFLEISEKLKENHKEFRFELRRCSKFSPAGAKNGRKSDKSRGREGGGTNFCFFKTFVKIVKKTLFRPYCFWSLSE